MAERVATLIAALQTGSPGEKLAAAEKLAHLGREACAAAVPLVEACETTDDQLREWAVAALEELGAPDVDDVEDLAALVERPSLDVAYWAATLLGRSEDRAAPAVPQLARALAGHSEMAVRQRVAWALGKIGPAADAARDALIRAAADSNRRLASVAQKAISRLDD